MPQRIGIRTNLFIIYTTDLASVVEGHGLSLHQYTDDSQIYGSCRSPAMYTLSADISKCTEDIAGWMRSYRFHLNTDNTEVMWCISCCRLLQLSRSSVVVAGVNVHPVSSLRDLAIFIDNDLSAATDVRKIVSRCFASFRQLSHLRRYVATNGVAFPLATRLCKLHISLATSLSSATTPVCAQRCSSTGVPSSTLTTTSLTPLQSSIGCVLLPPASGIVCPPNLRLCDPRLLLSDISRPVSSTLVCFCLSD